MPRVYAECIGWLAWLEFTALATWRSYKCWLEYRR